SADDLEALMEFFAMSEDVPAFAPDDLAFDITPNVYHRGWLSDEYSSIGGLGRPLVDFFMPAAHASKWALVRPAARKAIGKLRNIRSVIHEFDVDPKIARGYVRTLRDVLRAAKDPRSFSRNMAAMTRLVFNP